MQIEAEQEGGRERTRTLTHLNWDNEHNNDDNDTKRQLC